MRACMCTSIRSLVDDQDTVLGGDGARAMPSGLPALSARGAVATNWFVHTPVCACSRAEILTGKFFHNLADQPARADPWDRMGNTNGPCFPPRPASHGGCRGASSAPGRNMHVNLSLVSPGPTFASHLGRVGYDVGIFGKYAAHSTALHPFVAVCPCMRAWLLCAVYACSSATWGPYARVCGSRRQPRRACAHASMQTSERTHQARLPAVPARRHP